MRNFALNRPTARLIATVLLDAAANGTANQQAEDAVMMLAGALTSVPYGRQRRWDALAGLAPRLVGLLRDAGVDIGWVHNVDRRHIVAVRREIERAHAWFDSHGTWPRLCVALNTPDLAGEWPPYHSWRRAVWEVVNTARMDVIDRATSMLPLPRDVREAMVMQ
jgi:hypothetical protein